MKDRVDGKKRKEFLLQFCIYAQNGVTRKKVNIRINCVQRYARHCILTLFLSLFFKFLFYLSVFVGSLLLSLYSGVEHPRERYFSSVADSAKAPYTRGTTSHPSFLTPFAASANESCLGFSFFFPFRFVLFLLENTTHSRFLGMLYHRARKVERIILAFLLYNCIK